MNIIEDIAAFSKEEIKPMAGEIDQKQLFPRGLVKKLAEHKFFSVIFPKSIGGLELDPISYGLFFEHAGKYCSNVRNLFLVSISMVGGSILKCGTQNQVKYWLPQLMDGSMVGAFSMTEPEVGSDIASLQTTFEEVGGEFRLNGRKKWTTLGGMADFLLLIARNEDKTGVFIVETDRNGITRRDMQGLLGNRASHIAEIEFENVMVPKENLLGSLDYGMNKTVSVALDIGRYNTAWAGVALAQACLEEMVSYARTRSQFGKKIRTYQLIQKMIGDAVTNIHAAKALALKAGELRKENNPNSANETRMAKYFSSRMAMHVANDAMQIHGSNGYYNHFPVERYFREAKALEIIEGTSQVLVQIIAKHALMNIE
jgi:alkylation response protein AidB-like acyl-CoA dehydrogenase